MIDLLLSYGEAMYRKRNVVVILVVFYFLTLGYLNVLKRSSESDLERINSGILGETLKTVARDKIDDVLGKHEWKITLMFLGTFWFVVNKERKKLEYY